MAQPLSSVLKDNGAYSISFDPTCVQQEPKLAALIAETIARWSSMESFLKTILVSLLGSQAKPSFAMFSTFQATSSQIIAIEAAGKAVLSGENLEFFIAALSVVRTVGKERNKLAHWVWGHSPQVPNGLLLGDPDHLFKTAINIQQFREGFEDFLYKSTKPKKDSHELLKFDFDYIYVYRDSDLLRIQRDLEEAGKILGLINTLINPPSFVGHKRDEVCRRLSNLNLFRESLSRLREGQKNNPPTPGK